MLQNQSGGQIGWRLWNNNFFFLLYLVKCNKVSLDVVSNPALEYSEKAIGTGGSMHHVSYINEQSLFSTNLRQVQRKRVCHYLCVPNF